MITEETERNFREDEKCWFCDLPITEDEDGNIDKLKDHCHIIGKYLEAAQSH